MLVKGGKIKIEPYYSDRNDPNKTIEFKFGEDKKHGDYRLCQVKDRVYEDNKLLTKYIKVKIFGDLDFSVGDEVVVKEILGVAEIKGRTYVYVMVEEFYIEGMKIKQEEDGFNPYR